MVLHLIKRFFSCLVKTKLLWIPFLLLLVIGWLVIQESSFYVKEVIAFGFLTFAFSLLLLFFSRQKIRHKWFACFYVILLVLVFIKLSFYIYYGVQLSASALYVIFETNTEEASGFLKTYFSLKNIALLIVCFLLLGIVFIKQKSPLDKTKLIHYFSLLGALGCIAIIGYKLSDENLIIKSVRVYNEYTQTKKLIKSELSKKDNAFFKEVTALEEAQTYICIIGESTTSRHMQLYGYDRNTNPLLTEIAEELLIFNDVIAPNVHTILSLDKILTFSDHQQPNKTNNASIIQLANAAGFTTYWVSNQRPVGIHESISTIIGTAAHETYFTATNDYGDISYDEKVIPVIQKILDKPAKKKIVFVQLIGTHIIYKNRYPSNYAVFKGGNPKSPFNDKQDVATKIDEYDNAVLYNDYIIRSVIELLRKKNTFSAVTYFSDHGDEVYDTMEMRGHDEYHGTKPMYEVPFLMWFSKKYQQSAIYHPNMDLYRNRKYNLEDFMHTFASFTGIQANKIDRTRSIIDTSFIERPRIIKDTIHYDAKK